MSARHFPSTGNAQRDAERNKAGRWIIGWVSALLVAAALVAYHAWAYTHYPFTLTSAFFAITMVVAIIFAVAATRSVDYVEYLPPASGKILAVIPAYNEEPLILRQAIEALLSGTVVPDRIFVVDDGSEIPVRPYQHPLVTHIRQENAGKRRAQYVALRQFTPNDFDFILTVDSDSVIAPNAIEACLRAFTDPEIQAVTSIVTCREPRSLIGRLIDLEMVTGLFSLRRARSAFGAVTPTSGALSMYRSAPVLDNLEDYIASGTFSDDRRLAHYCLMRGKTVVVNQAIVASDMPETFVGTWRQRVRWYKGYWKYLNWELINLDGAAFWMRVYNTILSALFPLFMFWILVWLPATGRGFFWPVFVLWLALLYAQSVLYLRRPYKSLPYRILTWLFLTPLMIPFQMFLVRPAMYWAYFTMRSDQWDGHRVTGTASNGRNNGR